MRAIPRHLAQPGVTCRIPPLGCQRVKLSLFLGDLRREIVKLALSLSGIDQPDLGIKRFQLRLLGGPLLAAFNGGIYLRLKLGAAGNVLAVAGE
jgi:hypothetical protein